MAVRAKASRAGISWEGDSREVLREWPKDIRNDFGTSLDAMQEGKRRASLFAPCRLSLPAFLS